MFKRPGVDIFLQHLSQRFEIVVFSDQLSSYVDPIVERLDNKGSIHHRLYRDATKYVHGEHVRDLSKLNRPLTHTLYLTSNEKVRSPLPPPCAPLRSRPPNRSRLSAAQSESPE